MDRLAFNDPKRLGFQSGGGCMILFGLPFMLAGLAIMTAPFWAPPGDSPPPLVVVVPFGGLFAAIGGVFVLGRSRLTIDLRHRTVSEWSGALVFGKTTSHPLDAFSAVKVTREVRGSKNRYTVYAVTLDSSKVESIEVDAPVEQDEARALAEEVAKFTSFKVVDSSTGVEIVREADELDESLRDKAIRSETKVEVGPPPQGMQSRYRVVGGGYRFECPPTGFTPLHIFKAAAGVFIPTFVYFTFASEVLSDDSLPVEMKYVFGGFLGVFFMALPFLSLVGGALASARRHATVEVSSVKLLVRTHGLLWSSTVEIPTGELEELEVVSPKTGKSASGALAIFLGAQEIMARSDRASVRFGLGLSQDELQWIKRAVEQVVTS